MSARVHKSERVHEYMRSKSTQPFGAGKTERVHEIPSEMS